MKSQKSKNNDDELFSYLRSLGFLFPETEKELDRFNELYANFNHELNGRELSFQHIIDEVKKDEENVKTVKTNGGSSKTFILYFKRAVLAAEITSQLYEEPTFGHVKLQKLVYLCEQISRLDLSEQYSKQAAGPYDRKFMHTIDHEFKKQKWFQVSQEGHNKKFTYTPLDSLPKYKKYYQKYFSVYDHKIQWLIDTFRSKKTDYVELIATLFACLDEAIRNNENISESLIIKKFYDWSKEKKKFEKDEIKNALEWMKLNNLTPKAKLI